MIVLFGISLIVSGGAWVYFTRHIPKRIALRKRNIRRKSMGLKPIK